jgi:uncharacterized protein YbjT (DUF2867 family)
MSEVDVVTGAFGYTGRYITGRLLESGRGVKTLTGHPGRPNPFGDRVSVASFDFEDPRQLAEHLRGATTLYNTYWVRFPHESVTFERAVANSQTLIEAGGDAGTPTSATRSSVRPWFSGRNTSSSTTSPILRRLPVFGLPGSGSYRLRPVAVEDVAEICVRSGLGDTEEVIDAVGPETFTFEELVRLIARAVGRRRLFVHVPPAAALRPRRSVGWSARWW